jgi:hypothetical protein
MIQHELVQQDCLPSQQRQLADTNSPLGCSTFWCLLVLRIFLFAVLLDFPLLHLLLGLGLLFLFYCNLCKLEDGFHGFFSNWFFIHV